MNGFVTETPVQEVSAVEGTNAMEPDVLDFEDPNEG